MSAWLIDHPSVQCSPLPNQGTGYSPSGSLGELAVFAIPSLPFRFPTWLDQYPER
ncbi:hypothetical protein M413DRAFT_448251 [Hebeloma cylindrosporum]|uniref:Uncharacterized protein n=1 Tax=Hebeloma cylindrosporum TaxID=76867 RepID=A0A0C3C0C8_HEBCY|nr:hypothetical protein M413DRAFT_448251 [Hebeloma cylindrosporum h7]